MTNKLLLLFLLFCTNIHAQFPVGKNIKTGENELKTFLQTKGFHYLKTIEGTSLGLNKIRSLYFSEEFRIDLHVNEYENITIINFCSKKLKVIESLLNKLDFKKWVLTDESSSTSEHDITNYKYKTFKIEYDKSQTYKLFQFLIRADE